MTRPILTIALSIAFVLGIAPPAFADTCTIAPGITSTCDCFDIQTWGGTYTAHCTVGDEIWECIGFPQTGRWDCFPVAEMQTRNYSSDCSAGFSGWRRGNGGGFSRGDSYALTAGCGQAVNKPANNIAVRVQLQKWNGSAWTVCRDSNFLYNTVTTWGWIVTWDFGGDHPCGGGYYGTFTGAFEYNGGWHGGWVWSGYRYCSNVAVAGATSTASSCSGGSSSTASVEAEEGGPLPPPKQPRQKPSKPPERIGTESIRSAEELPAGLRVGPPSSF
jgi:hypothetical protein